ncbi:hypothetical protein BGX29_010558 [Mortierella sp. GBA35]|nr:hypothetical protein BGX29_010558 [Mortierella sp. GBA35]
MIQHPTPVASMVARLPNELLLEIFIRFAQLHPSSLHKLSTISRDWRSLFKAYGSMLWRTATTSAFPEACFSSFGSRDWQETFLIHWGWSSRSATTTVLVPGPPPPFGHPSLADDVLDDVSDEGVTTAPVVVSIQEAALLVQAGSSSGSYSGSGLHGHHHQHQHQHHDVHDHHFLLDQPSLDSMRRSFAGDSSSTTTVHHDQQHQQQQLTSTHSPRIPQLSPSASTSDGEILSCSLCTYSDICLIPQAQICVRTYRTRNGPLMQVLDWSMQHSVDMNVLEGDEVDSNADNGDFEGDDNVSDDGEVEMGQDIVAMVADRHQDLISGMAVNEEGTLLVSCSIDGTVRVWDVLVVEFGGNGSTKGKGVAAAAGGGNLGFLEKVQKFGCPIRARKLLTGHVGWVNAVAIEDTTVVSGGSDHTVRIWDALSGTLLRLIPDLFVSRDLDLGVFTVAIHKHQCQRGESIIGVGSVIEGYQIHNLETGELMIELDEPLTSRQHVEFETELYQQYASKMAITETVIVTNSKLAGMLCVWGRFTGELLYRIRVCGAKLGVVPVSGSEKGSNSDGGSGKSRRMSSMVSCGLNESSRGRRTMKAGIEAEDEEETVHTFKINKSGSMLMCTLCDGRVALFEFGSRTATEVIMSDSGSGSVPGFGGDGETDASS